jgi:hypothetical protein
MAAGFVIYVLISFVKGWMTSLLFPLAAIFLFR